MPRPSRESLILGEPAGEMSPREEIEFTAQQLYDPMANCQQIFDGLYRKLTDRQDVKNEAICNYYRGKAAEVIENNAARSRYNLARDLHQAVAAPLIHMAEVETSARLVGFLKGERPLTDVVTVSPSELDVFTRLEADDEEFAAVARVGLAASLDVAETLIREIEDDGHPYRKLWELYGKVFEELVECERAVRGDGYKRDSDPRKDMVVQQIETWTATLADIRAYVGLMPGRPGFLSAGKVILAGAESLSWRASVNQNKTKVIKEASRLALGLSGQPTAKDGDVKTVLVACPFANAWHTEEGIVIVSPDAMASVWRDESLRKGPWSPARHCPANILLSPPFPEKRQIIEDAYAMKEVYIGSVERLIPRPEGAAKAAELRANNVGFAALIANAAKP